MLLGVLNEFSRFPCAPLAVDDLHGQTFRPGDMFCHSDDSLQALLEAAPIYQAVMQPERTLSVVHL